MACGESGGSIHGAAVSFGKLGRRDESRRGTQECVRYNPMGMTVEKSQLMSASEIDRTLVRLAHELLEKTARFGPARVHWNTPPRGADGAAPGRGRLRRSKRVRMPVGVLDITFYRDDLSTVDIKPVVDTTDIEFDVVGKDIILMDDVLYTGRTIRAALDALFELGRPARVRLLVLIDRGHRELPIEAAFIGRTVQTTDTEIIEVKFQEIDGMEKVLLLRGASAEPGIIENARRIAWNRRTGPRRD